MTISRKTAVGLRASSKESTNALDPSNINSRLYAQLARLLDELEDADARNEITYPQRISALIAIGRLQVIFANLRKGAFTLGSGSKIAQYSAAFQKATHESSRGISDAGPGESFESDTGGDRFDDDA